MGKRITSAECCCFVGIACDPPCLITPEFMYVRFHGIGDEPGWPITGPDANDDWNETWWKLKQVPEDGRTCIYRASTEDPCDDDFGVVHTQPFPVVCEGFENMFISLTILTTGWGILSIGACGNFNNTDHQTRFSEPLGTLDEEGQMDCMNIDVNWTEERFAPGGLFCANWNTWSSTGNPDIDIKSPPDPG